MAIPQLSFMKGLTAWGGVITTISGVAYGIFKGGDIISYLITLTGVILTSAGHIIGMAQAAQQRADKQLADKRIEELEGMVREADELLRNPHFQRILEREKMDYWVEHQDDGR